MQIVYSTTPVENSEGRTVKNPRHFLAPVDGATKVFINGDHPKVKAAYEAAGVPVAEATEMRALPGRAKAEPKSEKPASNVVPPSV